MKKTTTKKRWRKFFENWKEIWRNPAAPIYTKAVLFNIFLYRSDEMGWHISERRMAKDLGIGKETASKAIDYLLRKQLITTGENKERKRRRLKLSGSLRSPDWVFNKPKDWTGEKPNKYQKEYQNNNSSKKEGIREGKMVKLLSPEELHERIQALKNRSKSKE